jgi:hypothetical protein
MKKKLRMAKARGFVDPILKLDQNSLRSVTGGDAGTSSMTGSYDSSNKPACCDGTKVCCCISDE